MAETIMRAANVNDKPDQLGDHGEDDRVLVVELRRGDVQIGATIAMGNRDHLGKVQLRNAFSRLGAAAVDTPKAW